MKEVKKIITFVANIWMMDTEYAGRTETYCFYCGTYQGKNFGKHKKSCLHIKAKEILEKGIKL